MTPLADIATAIRLLTVLPSGSAQGNHPARYFTWVGWLYGGVALALTSGAAYLNKADGIGALFTAAVIVCAWTVLSGCLHLDGLADCADALGVRGDALRKLAAMRDSTVGAFGVVAIVLALVVQVAAIALIIDSASWWALAAAPVLGRMGAAIALQTRAPARPDGLAASYAVRENPLGYVVLLLPVAALVALPPDVGRVLVTAAGAVTAVLVPGYFARRLGGITGDVLGATVVVTETAVLCICALAGGLT